MLPACSSDCPIQPSMLLMHVLLFAACWQKLVDKHAESMNPAAAADAEKNFQKFEVNELFNLLTDHDTEVATLREDEKERQEKAAKKAQQEKAKAAAENLTKQLLKHANHIRAGTPANQKNGKVVPAKLKHACAASLEAFKRSEGEVASARYALTLNGYDPESVADSQSSSRPGKRKAPETWNVRRRGSQTSTLTHSGVLSVRLYACTSQKLVAAFDDLKNAVQEFNNPVVVEVDRPAPPKPSSAPAAPAALPANVKSELAAKDRAIQSKDAALETKEAELKAVRDELAVAVKNEKESLDKIIEGAKAQGVCMHLH